MRRYDYNKIQIPKIEIEEDVKNNLTISMMSTKYNVSFNVIKRLCSEYNLKPLRGRQGGQNIKDMTGNKFGSLSVLRYDSNSKGKLAEWICQCVCGKTCSVLGTELRQGKVKTCGCRKGIINKRNFQGYGEIPKSKWRNIVQNAERRKIPLNLTIEEIDNLFKTQNRLCRFTGQILKIDSTASLDRIDSYKGYTIDNVQWVHKDVNKLKGQFSDEFFLNLCRTIVRYTENAK